MQCGLQAREAFLRTRFRDHSLAVLPRASLSRPRCTATAPPTAALRASHRTPAHRVTPPPSRRARRRYLLRRLAARGRRLRRAAAAAALQHVLEVELAGPVG